MAVLNLGSCGGGDKENAPPRGIAVKNQTAMKRRPAVRGKAARRRPPLRDITALFVAAPCRPLSSAAPPELAHAHAELPEAVRARAGASDRAAATAKQGRYSLRKAFR